MVKGTRCLITGARLMLPGERKSVWGDLHSCGAALIFNAVLNTEGEADWAWGGDPARLPLGEKRVEIPATFPYFERRGVIVFDKWNARFNAEAARHIHEGLQSGA